MRLHLECLTGDGVGSLLQDGADTVEANMESGFLSMLATTARERRDCADRTTCAYLQTKRDKLGHDTDLAETETA